MVALAAPLALAAHFCFLSRASHTSFASSPTVSDIVALTVRPSARHFRVALRAAERLWPSSS